MSFTRNIIRMLKKATTPRKTLSWDEKKSIVKVYPDDELKSLKKITTVQVSNEECVSCYTGNSFTGLLRTGTHDLSDNIDKIIFIDTSVQKEKFGIRAPNYPITLDGQSFGFSGNIAFKILDENTAISGFLANIVKEKKDYSSKEVMRWLRDGIFFTVFKEILETQTYKEFIGTERTDMMIELESRIGYELMDYGIELVSLEILNYTDPVKL